MNKPSSLYYGDYIHLEKILSSQSPRSVEYGRPAHDEMLFIIVHQAYELWFKQILHELDSVRAIFSSEFVDEKHVGVAVARLERITEIQRLLIEQIRVLETMTPLDFLDFRDLLYPASGFQSYQFRLVENRLGLKPDQRMLYNKEAYYANLSAEHQEIIRRSEGDPSVFDLIEKWLERTPFLQFEGFSFWDHYRTAVEGILRQDRVRITSDPLTTKEEKERQLHELSANEENFAAILDKTKHDELVGKGKRQLSHKAMQAALLIELYRDEPILHLPFKLLTTLVDIDELFTTWRYRHAIMAHRMIGTKIGTGGSTGYSYLKATVDRYKVFGDLFNLSTFLIPRSELPQLPEEVKKNLGFYYSFR
jgi:tryptophan 2,3-dioxygenase